MSRTDHHHRSLRADKSAGARRLDGHVQLRRAASVSLADIGAIKGAYNDDEFNTRKSFAGALTAAICVSAAGPSGAATNAASMSDVTVVFTATATESIVIDEGYQVNNLETLTNNMVTLSGGGPNLLGSTWQPGFAALGSNSYTFNDGTPVPALGFAAQDPPNVDTFSQMFATVPGKSYTYSFDYSNNNAPGLCGATESLLVATARSVPEASIWAMLLLGFAGLGFASYCARRAPADHLIQAY